MKTKVSNLTERNGWYYFRSRISGHSRKKEIRISLRTTNLQKAIIKCKLIRDKLKEIPIHGDNDLIPQEVIEERINQFIQESLKSAKEHMALYGKISQCTRDSAIASTIKTINACKLALRDNDYDNPLCSGEHILEGLDHDERDKIIAAQAMLQAQIYIAEISKARYKGDFDNDYDKNQITNIASRGYNPSSVQTVNVTPKPVKTFSIEELLERYKNEKSEHWGEIMKKSATEVFSTFLEVYGNKDITTVTHQVLLDYRDNILRRIPDRMRTRPEFKGLSVIDAIKKNKGKTIAPKTVNNRMSILGSFFKWCYNHQFISQNPATNLSLKISHKAHEERQPYSKDELETMFKAIACMDTNSSWWQPHKFWIPAISLYSGARQGEIAQMYVSDCIQVEGIPCFNITTDNEGDKKVKTEAGYRTIPIHPVLLQLDFLEYVLDQKKNGHERIWSEFRRTSKGYGASFERFFSRFNRKYITKDKKKVFHSLRHNYTNNLKQNGIEESVIAEMVGHSVNSMTFGRYGKPFEPKVLLEAMMKLDHGIDIFRILEIEPLSDEKIAEQVKQLPEKK